MHLPYNSTQLRNGLRVVTSTMPWVDSVALGVWIGVGGRHEPARLSGVSHFIEHMVFKGTEDHSARDIARDIEGRGGYYNAFTQEESTCYYAKSTPERAVDVLNILTDMIRRPAMRPQDVQLERSVILDEIAMYRDDPSQHVEDILNEMMWVRHPLGRSLTGDARSVARLTRQDVRTFRASRYVPNQTVIAFAGALEHSQALQASRAAMGRWKPRPTRGMRAVTPAVRQEQLQWLGRDIEQTNLALGFRLFGRWDPRRFALKLLSVLLAENMSSRLFQSLREAEGLAYSVQSSMALYEDTGTLVVTAGLEEGRLRRALTLAGREFRRLKNKRVGPRELKRAKDYAAGQIRTGLETSTSRMNWVGENLMSFGRVVQPAAVIDRLNAVTSEDLQHLANQILVPNTASLALIGPREAPANAKIMSWLFP